MRKLVTIRKIKSLKEHPNADKLQIAKIDGWDVVVAKSALHRENDYVAYFEVDSFLPVLEQFEFLRKSSFAKMGDKEGFRLKTVKLRGKISNGLIMPLTEIIGLIKDEELYNLVERLMIGNVNLRVANLNKQTDVIDKALAVDLSQELGVIKFEKEIPEEMDGIMIGHFPSFLRNTSQERIQNISDSIFEKDFHNRKFYITEKMDGIAFTAYIRDGHFGLCSRNVELIPSVVEHPICKAAVEHDIKNKLEHIYEVFQMNIAINCELIGEKLQKNHYDIEGRKLLLYSAYSIDECEYFNLDFLQSLSRILKIDMVHLVDDNFDMSQIKLGDQASALVEMATRKSYFNPQKRMEGLVFVSDGNDHQKGYLSKLFLTNFY